MREKCRKLGFFSWSMHMASIRLILQHHGVGSRSGTWTRVGGAWPILVTALIPYDEESLFCVLECEGKANDPGLWNCPCEAALWPRDFPCLLLGAGHLVRCLSSSTLNVIAVYAGRLLSRGMAVIKGCTGIARPCCRWCALTGQLKICLLDSWSDYWGKNYADFRKWVVTQTAWILPIYLWVARANL